MTAPRATRRPSLTSRLVCGALGGLVGAGCMTVVRMAARRRGLIEKTVSQSMEEWLAVRTRRRSAGAARPARHHLADQALHLGYGAALGALYGLAIPERRSNAALRGGVFGAATWVFGSWLLLPALGAKASPPRKPLQANAVDLCAHLLYGVATAVVGEELALQPGRGATSDAARRGTAVG